MRVRVGNVAVDNGWDENLGGGYITGSGGRRRGSSFLAFGVLPKYC